MDIGGMDRLMEMRTLEAVKLDRKTRSMAAVHVQSGMSADEAIIKAKEEQISFGDIFRSKLAGY